MEHCVYEHGIIRIQFAPQLHYVKILISFLLFNEMVERLNVLVQGYTIQRVTCK